MGHAQEALYGSIERMRCVYYRNFIVPSCSLVILLGCGSCFGAAADVAFAECLRFGPLTMMGGVEATASHGTLMILGT